MTALLSVPEMDTPRLINPLMPNEFIHAYPLYESIPF